jgi:hypothetical protein
LSFGMSDPIHNYIMDCGGVLVYTYSKILSTHYYSYPLMPTMTRTGVLQVRA